MIYELFKRTIKILTSGSFFISVRQKGASYDMNLSETVSWEPYEFCDHILECALISWLKVPMQESFGSLYSTKWMF